MEITLNKCPKDNKFKKSITVHAQGIDERVNINLETICDCDCEKDRLTVQRSLPTLHHRLLTYLF